MSGLFLAAASAASKARTPSHFSFDPSSTLVWSVPVLLIAPLVGLVLLLTGVRSRRGAASLAITTLIVTLLDALLVVWARWGSALPHLTTFSWIDISIAFTGDSRFQSFGINLSFRITHLNLALFVAILLVGLACVVWQRSAGRQEQGPVRSQGSLLLLVLAAGGVLVSSDLIALVGFWLLAGLASYFLLGNRWGTDAAGRAASVALALPFLGDVALLGCVGLLYAKFGVTEVDRLAPAYGHVAQVSEQYVGIAALLLLGAAFVRSALWPFISWQTATVDAPPALSAFVCAVWPLLAGHLLELNLPLFAAAGLLTPRIAAWALVIAAIVGPALAIATFDLRRSLLLASSGAVALCLLAIVFERSAAAGLAGLVAIAAGRAAMLLSAGWLVPQMRTADLRFLGGAWQRLRRASLGLAGGGLGLAAGGAAAAAWRGASLAWIGIALALLLTAASVARVWGTTSLGEVPHRRAFEPARVQEMRRGAGLATLGVGLLTVVATVAVFLPFWLRFLVHPAASPPAIAGPLLWLLPSLAGAAGALAVGGFRRRAALAFERRLAFLAWLALSRAGHVWRLVAVRLGLRAVRAVELRGLPAVESATGRALSTAGGLVARRSTSLVVIAAVAAALGILLAVAGLGGWR